MDPKPSDYERLRIEELNYNSYLKVPELTGLQQLQSLPPHHDEMFFIVIHQSFELWFKEVLHEIDLLMAYLAEGHVSRTLKVLKRVTSILECLCQQIQLLSTLTPEEFAGFREALGTGSGFQSVQFREVEFACGLRDPWFFQFFEGRPDELARLEARFNAPSIYDGFLRALASEGYPVPAKVLERDVAAPHELDEDVVEVIRGLYREPKENYPWILTCEALLDLDMLWAKWRATHILMVTRTIGGKKGTGGSTGAAFLESRLKLRFFPELWEVRNADWSR
jgi:tryptophan 2,3-dioxygenase